MSLRISNVRLSVDEPEANLPDRLARLLAMPAGAPLHFRILRKALDARDRHALLFVYTAEVVVPDDEALLARLASKRGHSHVQIDRYSEAPFVLPPPGQEVLAHRPVVVGSGPGGLAAAYFLAEQGYRPVVLERGRAVRDRIHDVRVRCGRLSGHGGDGRWYNTTPMPKEAAAPGNLRANGKSWIEARLAANEVSLFGRGEGKP